MNNFNIILADDHRMITDGLETVIKTNNLGTVKAKVVNGKELLQQLNNQRIDLIILDINMPILGGMETAEKIRVKYSHIKILVISQHDDIDMIRKMHDLGVHGYLSKMNAHDDLVEAINIIKTNEKVFPGLLYNSNKRDKKFLFVGNEEFKLSEREHEILLLIASGLSTKQIAVKLHLSEFTVETHRKNIGKKTGANSTARIVKFAIEHNLPLKS